MFVCSENACSEEHMFETMFVCSEAFLFNSCAIGAMFGTYVRTLFEAMFGGLHVRGATSSIGSQFHPMGVKFDPDWVKL